MLVSNSERRHGVVVLLLVISVSIPLQDVFSEQQPQESVVQREERMQEGNILISVGNTKSMSFQSLYGSHPYMSMLRGVQSRQLKDSLDYTQTNDSNDEEEVEEKVVKKRKKRRSKKSREDSHAVEGDEKSNFQKKEKRLNSEIPTIDVEVMNVRAHSATVVVNVDILSWVWCQIVSEKDNAKGTEFSPSLRRYQVEKSLTFQYNWLESNAPFSVTCKARNFQKAAYEKVSEVQHFQTIQETSCME